MTVLYVTESVGARMTPTQGIAPNFQRHAYFDGIANTNFRYKSLPGNEGWLDITGSSRVGLNAGPTFTNLGASAITLYGAPIPRQYAYQVEQEGQEGLVTAMADKWFQIAALTTGQSIPLNGAVYSVLRVVFAPGSTGALGMASL